MRSLTSSGFCAFATAAKHTVETASLAPRAVQNLRAEHADAVHRAAASAAIGSAPRTGRMAPSRDSSPTSRCPLVAGVAACPQIHLHIDQMRIDAIHSGAANKDQGLWKPKPGDAGLLYNAP
jgi:hypothetical protein